MRQRKYHYFLTLKLLGPSILKATHSEEIMSFHKQEIESELHVEISHDSETLKCEVLWRIKSAQT